MTVLTVNRITENPVNIVTGQRSPLLSDAQKVRGTVTLNGATPVTEANTYTTTNSDVGFTLKTVGGTVGAYPVIQTITPGTGFTFAGTAGDTSTYNYVMIG